MQHLGLCVQVTDVADTHVLCRNMFNKELLGKMKKGAWLVNTARGGICERDAIVEALESGQLGGGSAHSTLNLAFLMYTIFLMYVFTFSYIASAGMAPCIETRLSRVTVSFACFYMSKLICMR